MAKKKKKKNQEESGGGAPAWMVSFGDMMTLILTFFILLVSMSTERLPGLAAEGVGSFVVALRSHGLSGVMSASDQQRIFDHYRRKFLVPENEEGRDELQDVSQKELIQSQALDLLRPHREVTQPRIALFDGDSATLTSGARAYLDRLAETFEPRSGQILLLEGHAFDAGKNFQWDNHWLSYMRAESVRRYLIEEYGFRPDRVKARAWLEEVEETSPGLRGVDARLITPMEKDD